MSSSTLTNAPDPHDAPALSISTAPSETFGRFLDAMADDVLEKYLIESRASIDVALAEFTVAVGELDRRGLPDYDHDLTTAGWLREFCHMAIREASGMVKTAWAMTHMPTVTDNSGQGPEP
jgi:hypothetical protein